tara:strand:- start:11606 stop:12175 length:570 start_codon:yes stop_codon:yes gene_type:complete
MGGSRPPGQVVVMPEKKPAAQTFLQITPQSSFQALADSQKRIEEETNKIQQQRYDEVGTPSEIGARMAGRRVQEAASYLASLPTGQDRPVGFQKTPRPFDIQSTSQGTATVPTTQIAAAQPGITTPPAVSSKFQPAVDAAALRLQNAMTAYTKAKQRADTAGRPQGTISPTPEWAKIEDKEWQPKQVNV